MMICLQQRAEKQRRLLGIVVSEHAACCLLQLASLAAQQAVLSLLSHLPLYVLQKVSVH